MASDVSSPDEQFPGWNIELKYSDWWGQIVNGEGDRMGKAIDPHKQELENRFDTVGWGCCSFSSQHSRFPTGRPSTRRQPRSAA